jgi:hypothetical protein
VLSDVPVEELVDDGDVDDDAGDVVDAPEAVSANATPGA